MTAQPSSRKPLTVFLADSYQWVSSIRKPGFSCNARCETPKDIEAHRCSIAPFEKTLRCRTLCGLAARFGFGFGFRFQMPIHSTRNLPEGGQRIVQILRIRTPLRQTPWALKSTVNAFCGVLIPILYMTVQLRVHKAGLKAFLTSQNPHTLILRILQPFRMTCQVGRERSLVTCAPGMKAQGKGFGEDGFRG